MTDFTEMKRATLARHLAKHLRGEVRFDPTSRRLYSTDASIYQIEPLGVIIPKTVEDITVTVHRDLPQLLPLVRELSWTHNLLIMGKCKRDEEREFYLRLCLRERWGKRELNHWGASFRRDAPCP